MSSIRLFDVKWSTTSAGPSPDHNRRTELFFMGCKIAAAGKPCEGCFNPALWHVAPDVTVRLPQDVAKQVQRFSPNKFITIVGGEPTDQLEGLTSLCKLLKEDGFHILLFTHHTLSYMSIRPQFHPLLYYIDVLIDGKYIRDKHIYNKDAGDGLHDAIGSANQTIWDLKAYRDTDAKFVQGFRAGDLAGVYILPNHEILYITNDKNVKPQLLYPLLESA